MLLWLILNGVLRQTDNFQVVLFNAVTYFIYADSRKKYKRMNTLHAYNLLNESFFLLHKFTQMLVWFQKRCDSAIMLRGEIWCNVAKKFILYSSTQTICNES